MQVIKNGGMPIICQLFSFIPNELIKKAVDKYKSDKSYKTLKWVYLSAWQDLYTKKIVGWQLADNMREEMVREPLLRALLKRNKKNAPLIIHSDRGGQYLSDEMKKLVKTFTLKQSMSRADDPYDNATAESLWSRLKAELNMPKKGYDSIEILREVLFEYIEGVV